jgi:hypothetical protein
MQPVRHLAGFALVILLASASTLYGWGLTEKPFGFRLQITDDRTTNFFPAAHPILAMNPAGDDSVGVGANRAGKMRL